MFVVYSDPYGSRARLPGLKGRCLADRRTGRLGAYLSRMRAIRRAHLSRSGSGGARIRVCGFSGRRYAICGYRPNEKSPASCDTGLWISSGNWRPGVTIAMDTGRAYWPAVGRQSAPYRIVRVIYSTKNTFLTRSLVVVAFAGTTRISARRPVLFHLRRFSAANGSRKSRAAKRCTCMIRRGFGLFPSRGRNYSQAVVKHPGTASLTACRPVFVARRHRSSAWLGPTNRDANRLRGFGHRIGRRFPRARRRLRGGPSQVPWHDLGRRPPRRSRIGPGRGSG